MLLFQHEQVDWVESSIKIWICFVSLNCLSRTVQLDPGSEVIFSPVWWYKWHTQVVICDYYLFAMSFQEELLKKKSALKKTEVVANDKKQEQLIVKDSEDYDRLIKETYFEA